MTKRKLPKPSEIEIDVSNLKGKHLFLATPMYGGLCNGEYMSSVLQLQDACRNLEIGFSHCFLSNESLIDRGRNTLVDAFMKFDGGTHFLFVDADIQFRPNDILAMMHYDKDVICAPYPKKNINWDIIRAACILDPLAKKEDLAKLVGEYVFTPLEADSKLDQIIKVGEAGTGMMLIKREALERMQKHYPQDYYISDDSDSLRAGIKKEMHAFFKTGIVDKRYLSEDYMFCHNFRKMGGDIWLFPWALTTHFGTYGFQGSVGQLVDTMRKIEENAERLGKTNAGGS